MSDFLTVPLRFEGLTVRWESALPAADFEGELVRLSRRTFDAALAARSEVTFLGALRCESALPPAVFDFDPVDLLRRVLDAFEAARFPVTLDLGIRSTSPYRTLARAALVWPLYNPLE